MRVLAVVMLDVWVCGVVEAQDLSREWSRRLAEQTAVPAATPDRPWDLAAAVGERLFYDDNVFMREDERSEVIAATYLDGDVSYATSLVRSRLMVQSSYLWFEDESKFSDDEHRMLFLGRYGGRAAFVELRDHFRKESDPFDPTFGGRVERWVNRLDLTGSIPLSDRLGMEPGVGMTLTDFRPRAFDDGDNVTRHAWMNGTYQLMPRADVLLEVAYDDLDYDEGHRADSSALSVLGGMRGELTSRLFGMVKAGWHRRASDRDPTGDRSGLQTLAVTAGLRYEIADSTDAWVELLRTTEFALNGDFQARFSAAMWIRHQFSEDLSGLLEVRSLYSDAVESVERRRLSAQVQGEVRASSRVTLEAGVLYRQGTSEVDGEDFENVIVHIGVQVKLLP
ncbi:MAG: outer membrane beta-barrel protein [Planctomycetes bacterium]|nr:outer membrane beta-barrel protein [Planctomycetota bacterium]